MSQRKTCPVATLIYEANSMLRSSPIAWRDQRMGIIGLLERVLHDTDNYAGFRYLDGHEAVIAGNYDDTRRGYYTKSGLDSPRPVKS